MHMTMLWPLLVLTIAVKLYWIAVLLLKSRVMMLKLERGKTWARNVLAANERTLSV